MWAKRATAAPCGTSIAPPMPTMSLPAAPPAPALRLLSARHAWHDAASRNAPSIAPGNGTLRSATAGGGRPLGSCALERGVSTATLLHSPFPLPGYETATGAYFSYPVLHISYGSTAWSWKPPILESASASAGAPAPRSCDASGGGWALKAPASATLVPDCHLTPVRKCDSDGGAPVPGCRWGSRVKSLCYLGRAVCKGSAMAQLLTTALGMSSAGA
jgi:hypothetical protein